jgi:hypothetical protein
MPEATQYIYPFKELAEMMIKKQDLHEGLWAIYVKFGIQAANIGFGGEDYMPTAMVPILEIGIQKQDKPSSLTVNAAEVNPIVKARTAVKAKKVSLGKG